MSMDLAVDILDDPDFLSPFTIYRPNSAASAPERYDVDGNTLTVNYNTLNVLGSVQPSKAYDVINFLPEGERDKNSITIYSPVAMFKSDANGKLSDCLLWQGGFYRVQYARQWEEYNYWQVMATGFLPPNGSLPSA